MEDILAFTINPSDAADGVGTRWLSNFAPSKIKLDGEDYPNVEQAFQASKNLRPEWRSWCRLVKYPQTTKKLSHPLVLQYRADWSDKLMVKLMRGFLEQKFALEPYRSRLIATGTANLENGNKWRDEFWGTNVANRKGKNMLGLLIMDIRADIIKTNEQELNILKKDF